MTTVKKTATEYVASVRPFIAEVERLIAWANVFYDLKLTKKLTPIIQTRHRKKTFGHFRKESWTLKDGSLSAELSISAEDSGRDMYEVIETIMHEIAHAANHENGVKDCSVSGRHNKKFKAMAEHIGLDVADDGKHGWTATTLGGELRSLLEDSFAPKADAFGLFRNVESTKVSGSKLKKWECRNGHDNQAGRVVSARNAIDQSLPCPVCLYDALKGEGMADTLIQTIVDNTKLILA